MGEWTEPEDAALIKLVREHGVGDWNSKVDMLGTGRSSTSMRKRWKKLSDRVDFLPRPVVASARATGSAAGNAEPTRADVMRNALAAVRATTDSSSGRRLCEIFELLPSAEDYADYFEIIATPIDLSTIEENITKKCATSWPLSTCRFRNPCRSQLAVLLQVQRPMGKL